MWGLGKNVTEVPSPDAWRARVEAARDGLMTAVGTLGLAFAEADAAIKAAPPGTRWDPDAADLLERVRVLLRLPSESERTRQGSVQRASQPDPEVENERLAASARLAHPLAHQPEPGSGGMMPFVPRGSARQMGD